MKDQIAQSLKKHFSIETLEIEDDSLLHANHAEVKKSGGGHFSILIVSPDFKGKPLIKRHRMIYSVLKDVLKSSIHALKIKACAPEEMDLRS